MIYLYSQKCVYLNAHSLAQVQVPSHPITKIHMNQILLPHIVGQVFVKYPGMSCIMLMYKEMFDDSLPMLFVNQRAEPKSDHLSIIPQVTFNHDVHKSLRRIQEEIVPTVFCNNRQSNKCISHNFALWSKDHLSLVSCSLTRYSPIKRFPFPYNVGVLALCH